MEGITISLKRFEELLKKEYAFDLYAKKVSEDTYASELEKILFITEEKEDDF